MRLDIFITELGLFSFGNKEQTAVYPSDYHVFRIHWLICSNAGLHKGNSISGYNFVQFGDRFITKARLPTDSGNRFRVAIVL